MQAGSIKLHQALAMGFHTLGKTLVCVYQWRRNVQVQQRWKYPGDLLGAHPWRVFDARLIVRYGWRVGGETLKTGPVGNPG
ncbi:hypothetical protein D3C85_1700060 [compost metagenome]